MLRRYALLSCAAAAMLRYVLFFFFALRATLCWLRFHAMLAPCRAMLLPLPATLLMRHDASFMLPRF